MLNFSDYLKSFKHENSPAGDLARDFIASKSKATTYEGVLSHLNKNDADYIAIKLLKNLKRRYDEINKN